MSLKRIIVIVGLLLVSFGLSFGLSHFLSDPEQSPDADKKKDQDAQADQQAGGPVPDGEVDLRPSVRKANLLIRQLNVLLDQNRQKARSLTEREHRVKLTEARLKNQADELESLRVQLVAPLDRLKTIAKEIETSRIRIRAEEMANLRYTAGVYDKMSTDECAPILVAMIENDQLADAAKIYRFMSDRTAAKVLGEIQRTSKEAAVQLVDGTKRIQQNN